MGCRLNIAESETLREQLGDEEGLVVINSCAVTNEAVRQTRQAVRRARRNRPDARIVVTGCAAQLEPAMFADMPEVDLVLGNAEKQQPALFRPSPGDLKVRVADIMAVRETAPHLATAFSGRSRGFVEIQNGCDHRCTFCIIPHARGNSRSVPAGAVVDTVRTLVANGHVEIVLTGVDVTSYGHDLPGQPTLGQLVERILTHVPELRRLRLSSLDGVEIDERLFDLLAGEERIMPHVHLSLQSGDDMILKRMKRRHSRADAIAMAERLKAQRPEIAIGADIIAGFPTEDEAMHANNLSIIEACDIVHGHVFPFSPRTGTPAARMPQLDRSVIKRRAAELREATTRRAAQWRRSLIGSDAELLMENDGLHGITGNFARVRLDRQATPHAIVRARLTGCMDEMMTGTALI
ncbi:MAG: tRNA (N(6)-L-threonylcarbamoyladenosine(37)-C(2))-methylthiotransferase MtaB [Blastomonas sp.]